MCQADCVELYVVIVKRAFALSFEYGVFMDYFKHLLEAFHCFDGIINDCCSFFSHDTEF